MANEKYCKDCGTVNLTAATFCIQCGHKFSQPSGAERDNLVFLSQQVLIEAAKKGGEVAIDTAGSIVCDGAWPILKAAITPVFKQLQTKYPGMFGSPNEAQQAAQALAADAHLVALLHEEFDKNFKELKQGEVDILAVLAQQNEQLQEIADVGVSVQKTTVEGFQQLSIDIDRAIKAALQQRPMQRLSLEEIETEVHHLQNDAARWIEAGYAKTALRRVEEARSLLQEGRNEGLRDAYFLQLQGYVELEQHDVSTLMGNSQAAFSAVTAATEYFAASLKLNPHLSGSINGLALVYYLTERYDSAINYGEVAIQESLKGGRDYPSARFVIRDALEAQMGLGTPDDYHSVEQLKELLQHDRPSVYKLKATLEKLEELAPMFPGEFTVKTIQDNKKRLAQIQQAED